MTAQCWLRWMISHRLRRPHPLLPAVLARPRRAAQQPLVGHNCKSSFMTFQALLASKDDEAAAVLTPVLSGFGITAVCCSYSDAICRLTEQKFDAVIVDFDDPHSGALVLQNVQQSSSGGHIVTVALLSDKASVRKVFGEGANFVLYKPLSAGQAEAGLRAATALIKRERRIAYRVPVQVPVQLTVQDVQMEGILLDLSEGGMDILAAQPLCPGTSIEARFMLPDGESEIQVREIGRA